MNGFSVLAICMAGYLVVAPVAAEEGAAQAIESDLERSAAAWNAGDIRGFMESYWMSDALRFASGGEVRRGWQATLERYLARYGDAPESMGRLGFGDVEIDVLSDNTALAFGRWHLVWPDDRKAEGLFTLTYRKIDGRWLIVQDHTSAATE